MATQLASTSLAPSAPLGDVDVDTIAKLFYHAVEKYDRPDAMMAKEGGRWRQIGHAEVRQRVEQLAAALQGLGIERGDRVALLSENRPEWAISDYAVLCLGATDVPVYPTLPANQIAYILNDCEAKAILLSTREQLDKVLEIRDQVPSLQHVIAFDDAGGAEGVRQMAEMYDAGREAIERGEADDLRERAMGIGRDDLATLIYTSGTTGDPKGVMLTHYNLASNVAATSRNEIFEFEPGEIALSFLPLSHSFERLVDYYYYYCGICIAYAESIEQVADNLKEVSPHYMVSVPRLYEKIYTRVMGATGIKRALVMWAKRVGEEVADLRFQGKEPGALLRAQYGLADRLVFSKLRAGTGGRLKGAISGGAPLSAEVGKFFFAAGLPVYEGYGLTETSPVLTASRPDAVRLGTVGKPLPGTEIRIGEGGEILARGPQIMKGYWNRAEATAEVIEADGWFHTGDVGEIDSDGFLKITDRIKNLIVTAGGKNIAPQPIENKASMSPYVAQTVMIGDKRPYPVLLVVPDFENLRGWAAEHDIQSAGDEALARDPRVHQLLEQETLSRLDDFARYETPKKVAVIPREFTVEGGELTPTMKVKRRVIESEYKDLIEGLYKE